MTMRALKDGKSFNRPRPEPTEAEFQNLFDAVAAAGLDERLMAAFYDGTVSNLPLQDQCAAGVALIETVAALPDPESAFWISANFRESGRLAQSGPGQ
jgi:multidrug resistance efflux pump